MTPFHKYKGLVSVIVPCYNYAHFLSQTLESLLDQTYQNWECIIVDDGSEDNTNAIAGSYIQKDTRFRYCYQNNAGLSAARNTGIKNSRGEFLQFLDADDWIERRKLEVQTSLMENHRHIDIVYSNMRYFLSEDSSSRICCMWLKPEEDKEWMPRTSGKGEHVVETLLQGNIMVVNSPMIRRSLIDEVGMFDEKLKSWEDWDFWLRCALKDKFFYYDDLRETFALVRVHENSMSRNQWEMMFYSYLVRRKTNTFLTGKLQKKINQKYVHENLLSLTRLIADDLKNKDKERAIENLNRLFITTKFKKFKLFKFYAEIFSPYIFKKLITLHFQGFAMTIKHQFKKMSPV